MVLSVCCFKSMIVDNGVQIQKLLFEQESMFDDDVLQQCMIGFYFSIILFLLDTIAE